MITRFEPWRRSRSRGQHRPEVERISLADLETFYGQAATTPRETVPPPPVIAWQTPDATLREGGLETVSHGPSTRRQASAADNHPHVIIFRSEAQMVSEEGETPMAPSTGGSCHSTGLNDGG